MVKPTGLYARKLLPLIWISMASVGASGNASSSAGDDSFADMSLEDLVSMDVFKAASLLPTQANKAPGTVYRFDQGDFQRYGVRRLDDLLVFVPGFQLNQYRKRHRAIWSRGMLQRYNDKLVLMVDGVRQQHFYYGHFSLGDSFPLEQIESVEIIQGPASSLYGANAISGLISITTKDFSDSRDLTLSAEHGSNQRGKVTGLYNSERLQIFASYLDQEAPFNSDRRSFIGSDVLQPLDEDYKNFYIKAKPVDGLTLKLEYQQNETPFLFIPPTQNAFVDTEVWKASLFYETGSFDAGKLEIRAAYEDNQIREYEREQVTNAPGYEEFQNGRLAEVSIKGFKRWGDHTLALGGDWNQERAQDTSFERHFSFRSGFFPEPVSGDLLRDPDLVNDDFAVFVQDVWDYSDQLSITVGARYDKFDQFDGYLNYRIAATYQQSPEHSWKLLYGTGIRPPSVREYMKVLEGTSFAPPLPDAETIHSLELAYSYTGIAKQASVTLYHNRIDDFISEMPTPDGADEFFTNSFGKVDVRGLELIWDHALSSRLNYRIAASYTDVETGVYDNIPYVAEWAASATASYRLAGDHQLGLSVIYNDNRNDLNNFPDDEAEAFVMANLHLHGPITRNLSYRLGVDNLFDKTVYDPAGDFGGQHNSERSKREVWFSITWSL